MWRKVCLENAVGNVNRAKEGEIKRVRYLSLKGGRAIPI